MSRIQKVIQANNGIAFQDPDALYIFNYYNITKKNNTYLSDNKYFVGNNSYFIRSFQLQISYVDFRHHNNCTPVSIGYGMWSFLVNDISDLIIRLVPYVKKRNKRTKR